MKLEDQVCSLELAKRLKELGVKQESAFRWIPMGAEPVLCPVPEFDDDGETKYMPDACSAFTVAELGEMLPDEIVVGKKSYYLALRKRKIFYARPNDYEEEALPGVFPGDTESDARAKMLVYLLENKLVKPDV